MDVSLFSSPTKTTGHLYQQLVFANVDVHDEPIVNIDFFVGLGWFCEESKNRGRFPEMDAVLGVVLRRWEEKGVNTEYERVRGEKGKVTASSHLRIPTFIRPVGDRKYAYCL